MLTAKVRTHKPIYPVVVLEVAACNARPERPRWVEGSASVENASNFADKQCKVNADRRNESVFRLLCSKHEDVHDENSRQELRSGKSASELRTARSSGASLTISKNTPCATLMVGVNVVCTLVIFPGMIAPTIHAATIDAKICSGHNSMPRTRGMFPVTIRPSVTAGLNNPPLTLYMVHTVTNTAKP